MATMPKLGFIEPAMPALVEIPPVGPGWIHEIKQDGYRTQLVIEKGIGRAFSRRGLDWTSQYGPTLQAARALPVQSAILDGEMVIADVNGAADFHALRSAVTRLPEQLVRRLRSLAPQWQRYPRETNRGAPGNFA